MNDIIESNDKFPKGSVLIKNLGFIAKFLEHLKGAGFEIAVLGIAIGQILNKGDNFVLATFCLTILGITSTNYHVD